MRTVSAAIVVQLCGLVSAQAMDGLALAEACRGEAHRRPVDCIAYVVGTYDGSLVGAMMATNMPSAKFDDVSRILGICQPADVDITGTQMAEIVVKYLNDHPDKLHLQASYSVLSALLQTFPCK